MNHQIFSLHSKHKIGQMDLNNHFSALEIGQMLTTK
jgi:hypothetical protein